MSTLITILHVIVCLFLMLTVLLQSGKGGGMGAAFGGGNAATVFGGSGASTFLRRLTAGAGTIFMLTSMLLAFLASHNSADALEKFGEQQQKIADDKEAAKKKVLETPGTGSATGSGSAATSTGSATPAEPGAGSNATAAPAESPTTPANPAEANGPNGGASGTAVTPSENPNSATKPGSLPNPATPASMSAPAKDDAKKATPPAPASATPPAAGSAEIKTNEPRDLKPTDSPRPADTSPNAPK
jgi:preprotein translocase subunit SecG